MSLSFTVQISHEINISKRAFHLSSIKEFKDIYIHKDDSIVVFHNNQN